ncbi:amino acid adenylation domain-containing protein, partial [Geitlerinema sp. P-1104]|uniref:amino acid adenylation domain-containing protein n=1 Tax=Geitlerinema sp. P-1104 TaxID=2546230 RepID=UPI0014776AC8
MTNLPDPTQPLQATWVGSVIDKFCQQVKEVPNNVALIDRNKKWSYQELDQSSDQLAQQLQEKGLRCQDVIAVYASRSADLVVALLGILKIGASFTILDSAYPASRLRHCCQLSNLKGFIHLHCAGDLPQELQHFLEEIEIAYFAFPNSPNQDSQWETDAHHLQPYPSIHADDKAYIAFTSGSTGQPKGIIGSHRPLSHFIDWHCQKFGLGEQDRFSLLSGLSHDPLLRDIFTPLWLGATLVVPEQQTIETRGKLAQWMQEQGITVAHLTPAMGMLLAEGLASSSNSVLVPSLRYLFWGGDSLTDSDIKRSQKLNHNVTNVNFYGATETPQAMAYYVVPKTRELSSKKVPLGRGIDGVQLLVVTPDGSLAKLGEPGEIWIRTPYLALGYLQDEALTQMKFVQNIFRDGSDLPEEDRIYKTGDLGCYGADGNVEIIGRIDNQVKVRGFRIELSEIESVLADSEYVQKAVVLLRENELKQGGLTQSLIAYCLPQNNCSLKTSQLRQFLEEQLPYYMIPQVFVTVSEWPLTPNGKIDKQALAKLDLSREMVNTYKAPQDELEQELVRIWQASLNQKQIGVQDNFFELGGHSLLAIYLCSEVEKYLNRSVPISVLFQNPTIQEFANRLRGETGELVGSSIISIQPKGNKPPIFGIHVLGRGLNYYRPLTKRLGNNQPLYGVTLDLSSHPEGDSKGIKELAAIYIQDIQTIQPHGPYYFLGVSIGGRVAFEMAYQLEKQGEDVALLGLLDTTARTGVKHLPPSSRVSGHWEKFQAEGLGYLTRKLKSRFGRIKYRVKAMRAQLYQRLGKQVPDDLKMIANLETNIKIKKQHFPQPYQGKVTLFRAKDRKAEVG